MFKEVRFYSNILWPCILCGVLGCVPLLISLVPPFDPKRLMNLGLPASSFAVFGILAFVIARKIWPVYAGSDGVRSYTALGRYVDVPWEEMKSVSKEVGYYWILTNKGQRVSVPTWLEQQVEFNQYVVSHAPVNCPLRQRLIQPFY